MAARPTDIQDVCSSNVELYPERSKCCYMCDGRYGPCFNEPICRTCHLFIFSEKPSRSVQEDVRHYSMEVGDLDRGSDNSAYSIVDITPSLDVAQRPEYESKMPVVNTQPFHADRNFFQNLPPELLLNMASYLDDLSLWNVSMVCTKWNQLLRFSNILEKRWYRLMKTCWPLYKTSKPVNDFHFISTVLINSSSCKLCIRRMFNRQSIDCPTRWNDEEMRKIRIHNEYKNLRRDIPRKIRAIPFDNQYYHWQATIMGPAGSPYEGGKFFLYIYIPNGYPMIPPVVKFVTKIFHPNISRHGDIGLDSLHDNWNSGLTVVFILISIQSLLTDPFCNVCMEPAIAQIYNNDPQTYNEIARNWTLKFAMNDI